MPTKKRKAIKPTKRKTAGRKAGTTPRRRPTSKAPRRANGAKKCQRCGFKGSAGPLNSCRNCGGALPRRKKNAIPSMGARIQRAIEEAKRKGKLPTAAAAAKRIDAHMKKKYGREYNPIKLKPGKAVSLRGRKSIKLLKRGGKTFLEVR